MMQEALLALNEAVRIAQQHNDNVALAHALGALCQILATAAPAAVTQLTEAGTAAAHPFGHLSQLLKILKRYGSVVRNLSLVTWAWGGGGIGGGKMGALRHHRGVRTAGSSPYCHTLE